MFNCCPLAAFTTLEKLNRRHIYLFEGLITLPLGGVGHDLWRTYKASSKEPSLSSPEPRAVEFGIDWTVETFESFCQQEIST